MNTRTSCEQHQQQRADHLAGRSVLVVVLLVGVAAAALGEQRRQQRQVLRACMQLGAAVAAVQVRSVVLLELLLGS